MRQPLCSNDNILKSFYGPQAHVDFLQARVTSSSGATEAQKQVANAPEEPPAYASKEPAAVGDEAMLEPT